MDTNKIRTVFTGITLEECGLPKNVCPKKAKGLSIAFTGRESVEGAANALACVVAQEPSHCIGLFVFKSNGAILIDKDADHIFRTYIIDRLNSENTIADIFKETNAEKMVLFVYAANRRYQVVSK